MITACEHRSFAAHPTLAPEQVTLSPGDTPVGVSSLDAATSQQDVFIGSAACRLSSKSGSQLSTLIARDDAAGAWDWIWNNFVPVLDDRRKLAMGAVCAEHALSRGLTDADELRDGLVAIYHRLAQIDDQNRLSYLEKAVQVRRAALTALTVGERLSANWPFLQEAMLCLIQKCFGVHFDEWSIRYQGLKSFTPIDIPLYSEVLVEYAKIVSEGLDSLSPHWLPGLVAMAKSSEEKSILVDLFLAPLLATGGLTVKCPED
jgi:hypothetical protein